MFINSKTRQPVGPNIHGEIWCQSPIKLGGSDKIKKLESKYDAKRSSEGSLRLFLIDFIIIISKIVYKIQ